MDSAAVRDFIAASETTGTGDNPAPQPKPVPKFHRMAQYFEVIHTASTLHTLVDTADLTVAEVTNVSEVTNFTGARLFPTGFLSEADARILDRKLVVVVQELMKEKIEDAVATLKDLGIEVDASTYAQYVQEVDEL